MYDDDLNASRFPWLRSGFDFEGYLGMAGAIVLSLLLWMVWGPLFWIGFIAGLLILFATRTGKRTPPKAEGLIVAPCDGIVVSIAGAVPPDELRLTGSGWTRMRISVGPTKTNGLYAPMDGAIDHIIMETGDPAAFLANAPDTAGLAAAYVSMRSGERSTGYRVATGGLGPRLEVKAETGDAVRIGRHIGTLRLGGWCDVYLPAGVDIIPLPGQTLIGAESPLAAFPAEVTERPAPQAADVVPPMAADLEDEDDDDLSDVFEESLTLEKLGDGAARSEPAEDTDDVSAMFARLRKEARKTYESDS